MKKRLAGLLVVLFVLVSCTAVLQDQWNQMSSQDQAKIILNGFQDQLSDNWRIAKTYVEANPTNVDLQATWKVSIVPAFDVANKAIASSLTLAAQNKITPDAVYREVMPMVQKVLDLLVSRGIIKKK